MSCTDFSHEDREALFELYRSYGIEEILLEIADFCQDDANKALKEGDAPSLAGFTDVGGALRMLAPGVRKALRER